MNKKNLVYQSIDYIMGHLSEELSLDDVASHLHISKYHFCRLFKEETSETIYAFIKRSKIDSSAVDMKLNPMKSITDVGLDYGYSSSNYSSVFKKQHGTTPTLFKQSLPMHSIFVPFEPARIVHFKTMKEYEMQIDLQVFDNFFVLYERFIGNYKDIEHNWYQFLDKYKAYQSEETILLERFFNDPSITETSQCIYDICMTVPYDCNVDNVMWIKGGKWIVYHFDGDMKDIFETLQGVFSVWLPQSGYHMEQRYGVNIYHHIDRKEHRVVMDLCIPIE